MAVSPRSSKVGLNIGTTSSWGTATAVGAGDGVWVTDDLKVQLKMQVDEDDSAGQDFIGSMQVANHEAVKAEIPTLLHYNDLFQNVYWALACGTGGTAPAAVGTSTAYTNTFEPATNKTGLFATIVRDKVTFIEEVVNAKCTGFELSFGDNGRGEVTWMFAGNKVKVDSTVNTATQVAALTFPTQGLRAFFKQAVFRVNAASGGALGTGDTLQVTDLKIAYKQPMDELFVAGLDYVIQPEDNKYPDISVEWTFARLDSATDDYIGYHRDNTSLKGDLTLTGPLAVGTATYYGLLMQFPNLIVMEAPTPFKKGAENVHPSVKAMAYKVTGTQGPTGMTAVMKPFRLTTTGLSSANPFA
jgi:hypothetical protein